MELIEFDLDRVSNRDDVTTTLYQQQGVEVHYTVNGVNAYTEIGIYSGVLGVNLLFAYDSPGLGDDETLLQAGDSSRPSFMVVNGSLALLGPHYFVGTLGDGTPVSGDSFVPNYVTQINGLMSGESLTLVPEPSGLLLLGAGLLALGLRRRRRRAA